MTNIAKTVWKYIDNRIEIQKALLEGLINTSSLARKIVEDEHLEKNIDAVLSAIRRYEFKIEKKDQFLKLNQLLKKAKISTKTKLSSILIKRNDETENKVGLIYSKIDLKRETTLRIFEVTNYIKIIMDDELYNPIKALFNDKHIENIEKNLGELTINYRDNITKIPGVFARIANEMGINELSIVDSIICHWEHIIIVKEEDLEKAFSIVINLTKN